MQEINNYQINESNYDEIYVISDLHGDIELFSKMIEKLDLKKDELLIIAGDSCDRGAESASIYQKIIEMKEKGFNLIHLRGNHEKMFFDYMVFEEGYKLWMLNGGKQTLLSYENHNFDLEKHLDLIDEMPHFVESDNYIIVHAGLNPAKRLSEQSEEDLLWIRERFIGAKLKYIDKTVVFGHTPTESGKICYYSNNTLGIDCGSYLHKRLGAFSLKDEQEYYVSRR